ncbi:LemA family protein [Patescibacteria group bacterium]|nr:LemA family protein [Patescibacteria group bacterium]MBU1921853.1 LemA family protein [Patescibacteria group bacterium]
MLAVYIIVAVVAVVAVWFIATYNGLITLRNRTDEAWSDIDVQLKRRHDLIPNLVNTVQGYASHEKQLFENVTQARAAAMGAKSPEEHAKAENTLTQTLKSLFAVAENYPELRASENFAKLQDELSDTENKIQASRRFYNGNVRDINTKMQKFPTNLIAGMLGFKVYEFFEIEQMERETPEVKF